MINRCRVFLGRARWLGEVLNNPDWPDFSEAGIQSHLADWCAGQRDLEAVRALPWRALIDGLLTSQQRSQLAREAPESFTLPSGRHVLLTYEAGKPPCWPRASQSSSACARHRALPRVACVCSCISWPPTIVANKSLTTWPAFGKTLIKKSANNFAAATRNTNGPKIPSGQLSSLKIEGYDCSFL